MLKTYDVLLNTHCISRCFAESPMDAYLKVCKVNHPSALIVKDANRNKMYKITRQPHRYGKCDYIVEEI